MSIWDAIELSQIQNVKDEQEAIRSQVERSSEQSEVLGNQLTHRFEKVLLVTEAMWELVSERLGITLDDLVARVHEVDARDGSIDSTRGVPTGTPLLRCPACQAAVPLGKGTCQFCGAKVAEAKDDPFRV